MVWLVCAWVWYIYFKFGVFRAHFHMYSASRQKASKWKQEKNTEVKGTNLSCALTKIIFVSLALFAIATPPHNHWKRFYVTFFGSPFICSLFPFVHSFVFFFLSFFTDILSLFYLNCVFFFCTLFHFVLFGKRWKILEAPFFWERRARKTSNTRDI